MAIAVLDQIDHNKHLNYADSLVKKGLCGEAARVLESLKNAYLNSDQHKRYCDLKQQLDEVHG